MTKYRMFDLLIVIGLLPFFSLLATIIYMYLYFSGVRPMFQQQRVGYNQKLFTIYKFRTMVEGTANVGTHELANINYVPNGRTLRRFKLDELPQLLNVLLGDMSLVGPRPCLPNQTQLIELRKERGLFDCLPGLTGDAQVRDIDMSNPEVLVRVESEMMNNFNFITYLRVLLLTCRKIAKI